ncbi:MAG: tripartite tricarboxylate transporter substrate binding protein BugD [Hyphomicrobiales bacterium]|nr:tripartite tricarboxylate transporter substrate binding protein BugD [Hyphomicrobiales bacterium]
MTLGPVRTKRKDEHMLRGWWLVLMLALPAPAATAQSYPSRPITVVLPYPAGAANDRIARVLAERMRTALGQPVLVENVAGASGTIGVGRVARAAPDGYTLTFGGWVGHVLNGAVYNLKYDLVSDFSPIALVTAQPMLFVAKKTLPAGNLEELIAWLRANPDKALQGAAGAGTTGHIAGVFFQKETGTRFQIVPYRGLGLALNDLLAGQIDFMIDLPVNALPQVRAGTIKAYAVTARSRMTIAPEIPTVDEAGLPGFYVSTWSALWAPGGTPRDVIDRLNAAVVEGLADPAVRARLGDLGQDIYPREQQTPEALAGFHKDEIEKWWPIIKAANIKGD